MKFLIYFIKGFGNSLTLISPKNTRYPYGMVEGSLKLDWNCIIKDMYKIIKKDNK